MARKTSLDRKNLLKFLCNVGEMKKEEASNLEQEQIVREDVMKKMDH